MPGRSYQLPSWRLRAAWELLTWRSIPRINRPPLQQFLESCRKWQGRLHNACFLLRIPHNLEQKGTLQTQQLGEFWVCLVCSLTLPWINFWPRWARSNLFVWILWLLFARGMLRWKRMSDRWFFFFFNCSWVTGLAWSVNTHSSYRALETCAVAPGREACGGRAEDQDLGVLVLPQALPLNSCVAHASPFLSPLHLLPRGQLFCGSVLP